MTAETITFVVGALIVLTGGIGVVASKNPVHSALFLVQTLMGVALLFVVQEAHFLAAVQIIVYAGAIVILFLFVIMLLGVDKTEEWQLKEPIAGQQPLAAVIGAALLGLGVVVTIIATDGLSGKVRGVGDKALTSEYTDVERIGRVLFSDYALSFEITAGLLTIAVIAAVVLTRSVRREDELEDLEPASMALPPAAPFGANDSDHHELGHPGSDPRPNSDDVEAADDGGGD
ncbi:MAG: NADH-quinone oxidoreductase subunit J [Acidimicrobiales bacterium]